ncbi:MAG: HAD family phosphatase [Lachnospiraceae bacterium]|nr:HAD family phosphatase [Lachnospiraceae bacterium]MBR3470928.1 HAD family phosphatase [Lachnospiraceae bacterium]
MIKNVIFDIGNVLTDFRWAEFLADKGFSEEEIRRIAKASVLSPVWPELDRGVWSFEEVMAGFVKNDPGMEEEFHRAYDDMTDIVTIRDYAIEWVKSLKKQGFSVYFLSNFSQKIEKECEKALVFRKEMDGGILSWKDKLIKPDPEIYKLCLTRFGLKPEESVFVDDTAVNVEAANELGIHGIVFRSREQVDQKLAELTKTV